MPKSTTACNNILALIFNATTWNNIAEDDSTSPNTDLYLSLHTASPGVGGAQTTNETAYTNYVRIPVERTTSGWDAPAAGTAKAGISSDITVSGDLVTAEACAAAVWSALAASFNEVGTMGEKMNDAGAAGNPWAALLADNTTTATFGEFVQKLLTTNKFIGLK
jgi:hypothetical protein